MSSFPGWGRLGWGDIIYLRHSEQNILEFEQEFIQSAKNPMQVLLGILRVLKIVALRMTLRILNDFVAQTLSRISNFH